MLVHLINLDRSKERLAEFTSVNRHLTAVTRFAAVDGAKLDVNALIEKGVITTGLVAKGFFTIGALGAALSHKALWQRAVETNAALTIAEDDVIIHSQFESLAPKIIKTLSATWDLIFWRLYT